MTQAKKFLTASLLSLLIACDAQQVEQKDDASHAANQGIEVRDYDGSLISLDKPAERIIALAPHIVENIFTAGAGDKLVGVFAHSDYPEAAKSLPIVGGYSKTNFEKILELQPDLVIAWKSGNSQTSIARIQELGFPVYVDQPDKLSDIAKSIKDIGILSGTRRISEAAVTSYVQKLEHLRSQQLEKPLVTTFYQVWNKPLRTINGNHIISDAIELCGGVNIYADESVVAPIINIESILERDPEAILASGVSDSRPQWLDEWKQWPSLKAVAEDNLFFVNPNHIQRHSVRIIQGIEVVCRQLQQAREKRRHG